MTLDYLRHVFELYPRVPDVIRIDEDDGTLLVAAGAGVTKHGGRPHTVPVHLCLEGFEKLTTAPGAAAFFAGGGAHEDLA